MPAPSDKQLDAAIREEVERQAKAQINELCFGLAWERATLCGFAEESDRSLYAELHRQDPEDCREVLARTWEVAA